MSMAVSSKSANERPRRFSSPILLLLAAGFGLLWNAFGVFQFVSSMSATPESLVAMGMTPSAAAAVTSYPLWMSLAFAVGTFGGMAGSALLLLRSSHATWVFAGSLAGYVLLYVGDVVEGVFAALGLGQVVILTLVVAIAAGLLWVSVWARRTGVIR